MTFRLPDQPAGMAGRREPGQCVTDFDPYAERER